MIEFVFFSLCPRHSLSQKQPVQTREEISSSSSLFLDCKTTFSSKKKKKTPSFPSKKESITRAWKSKPYARIARVNTVFAFRAFFHLFSCTRSGSGSKVYERFFFLFCVFSRVFFSREKIVPLFFSFFFFSFFFFLEKLSFLGVRKRREKIYISKEARVFVQRERRIFAPPLTLERYRRKGNSRRYYFFLLSFCRCCVVRFAAGNKVCHQFVTKKGCWNIFGTTDQKEKEVRKSEKERGADSAETAQSPKGEKRFKTLVSTQNYL